MPKNISILRSPRIIDNDIIKWGQEAVEVAEKAGRVVQEGVNRAISKNGLKFEWRIVNGQIDSIYPVF